MGVGAWGLLIGAGAGVVALKQQHELDDGGCRNGVCYEDQRSDVDNYNAMRTLSTVGFIVGGIGGAAGAALLLTAPSTAEGGVAVSGWVGVGAAGVAGRF